jgi:cellulose biosynthesis protein BcsQ
MRRGARSSCSTSIARRRCATGTPTARRRSRKSIRPKSFRVTEAKTALSMLGLVATTSIVQRNDHQDAQGAGLGVTEYDPNGKAAEEVRELWQWIEKTLRKVGNGKKAA